MALGDGANWDEANPVQSTLANTIDSYDRDIRIGVRGRMANEHVWLSSQSNTANAGQHTYITLQPQTGVPTIPVVNGTTQSGMLFMTAGNLTFQNSAGSLATVVSSGKTALTIIGAQYSATGALGEMIIGQSGGAIQILAPGASGQIMVATTGGTGIIWQSDTGQAFGVHLDYGNSLTTGVAVSNTNTKIYRGRATLSSGQAAISGLGFTNATSYSVSAIRANTTHTEAIFCTGFSGGGFTINGNLSNSDIVSWYAIGS